MGGWVGGFTFADVGDVGVDAIGLLLARGIDLGGWVGGWVGGLVGIRSM